MNRVDSDRWLYRTAGGDFGPVTTDGLLAAIEAKKVAGETLISALGTQQWAPAEEFALFRDHIDKCKHRWEREDAKRAAAEIGRKIELRQKTSLGAGLVIGGGAVMGLGFVAWVVWRLSMASPIGLDRLPTLGEVSGLPTPVRAAPREAPLPVPVEHKVARLGEPESYDTAGVAIGVGDAGHVTKLEFDESGEVQAIAQGDLDRIVGEARAGLHVCARDAALRSEGFTGTDVGFTIAPGGLSRITVGAEARGKPALLACVKAALAKIAVPSFGGSERRVTVPLKVVR
jgi:hypothetical protein